MNHSACAKLKYLLLLLPICFSHSGRLACMFLFFQVKSSLHTFLDSQTFSRTSPKCLNEACEKWLIWLPVNSFESPPSDSSPNTMKGPLSLTRPHNILLVSSWSTFQIWIFQSLPKWFRWHPIQQWYYSEYQYLRCRLIECNRQSLKYYNGTVLKLFIYEL